MLLYTNLVFLCQFVSGKGIQLGSAQWTAKQSHSGFSISFFWPSLSESVAKVGTSVSKKNSSRKKREARAAFKRVSQEATDKVASAQQLQDPIKLRSCSSNCCPPTYRTSDLVNQSKSSTEEPVNLANCESVVYEMKDQVPGVRYTPPDGGDDKWTPVVKKTRGKKHLKSSEGCSPIDYTDLTSDSSSSELDVYCSRLVEYSIREGVPGLAIHHRNTAWSPIAPSPVAARTRSRTRK